MNDSLMMWSGILAGVGLLLFAVLANNHWQRATAGSLLLLVWLATAVNSNVRLNYQREASEILIRNMGERALAGVEVIPHDLIQDSVQKLDRGEDPLDVMFRLPLELKKSAQQGGAPKP